MLPPQSMLPGDVLGQLIQKAKSLQVKPTQSMTVVLRINGELVLVVIAAGDAAVAAHIKTSQAMIDAGLAVVDPRSSDFKDLRV